jgi:lactate dehydrogenase-like 2-hydroxyacid dehydrogenase
MSKPIVVVTHHFPDDVEARIEREYFARRQPNKTPFTPEELLSASAGADALFITSFDRLDEDFFSRVSSSVKIIATYSAGYEHIDLRAAAGRNIPIAHTPGINSNATADVTMLLLLGASRRAYEAQQLLRNGDWKPLSSAQLLGRELTGKILGIIGMGHVGQAVAQRARGFGMKVHYTNPSRLPDDIVGAATYHESPLDLLRKSAFLSLNAPETPETHHFINSRTIELLPQGAIIVNTARGGLVVDEDLIAALKSGRIAAAGLDVFEGEPNLHPDYVGLLNTFLLPHIGGGTVEAVTAMGMLALDNIDAILAGRPAPTLVETNV